jgi:hypothetical protein
MNVLFPFPSTLILKDFYIDFLLYALFSDKNIYILSASYFPYLFFDVNYIIKVSF